MRKVMLPYDNKEASLNALPFAAKLSSLLGCGLELFHVIPKTSFFRETDITGQMWQEKKEKAGKNLQALCTEVEAEYSIPCEFTLIQGYLDEEISKLRDLDYHFVVMGTDGAQDWERFIFGTHTEKVIRQSEVPVMVIPNLPIPSSIDHITFACRYEDQNNSCMDKLVALATLAEARLTILHVGEHSNEESEELFNVFKDLVSERYDYPIEFKYMVAGEVVNGLIDYLDNNTVDLLALLTRHRPFVDSIFHKSTTSEMAKVAAYRLLIYHNCDR